MTVYKRKAKGDSMKLFDMLCESIHNDKAAGCLNGHHALRGMKYDCGVLM